MHRSMFVEEAPWTPEGYLLANVIDAIEQGNWQRQGEKATRANKPKPFPRPDPKNKQKKEDLLRRLRNLGLDK